MLDIHLTQIITWLITGIAGAFGVGVGYATIREKLKGFQKEFQIYRETTAAAAAAAAIVASEQLVTIKERVSKVEGKMEGQVGYERCRDMREDCSKALAMQLADLSRQVSDNRNIVTAALHEIHTFIGKVDAHILMNGKK